MKKSTEEEDKLIVVGDITYKKIIEDMNHKFVYLGKTTRGLPQKMIFMIPTYEFIKVWIKKGTEQTDHEEICIEKIETVITRIMIKSQ